MSEAKIVSDKPRTSSYTLQWPIDYNGRTITQLLLKRVTVGEIAEWQKKSEETKGDSRLPIFVMMDGSDISEDVWAAMDVDDMDALSEAAMDFLPKRYRALMES